MDAVGPGIVKAANPAACLNLDPRAVAFLNVLVNLKKMYYGYGSGDLPMLLSLLSKLELPLFKGSTHSGKIEHRLQVLPDPVDVTIDLHQTANGVRLLAGYERDGQFVPIQTPVDCPVAPPGVGRSGRRGRPTARAPGARSCSAPSRSRFRPRDVDAFRERFFVQLAQTLTIRSGVVQWRDVQADPVPRLYLRDDKARAACWPSCVLATASTKCRRSRRAEPVSVATIPDTWELVRIHRNPERETAILQSLAGATYGLKRGGTRQPYGTFALRARVHPFDFLLHSVPRLAQAGFEIYGEESLKIGKINRKHAHAAGHVSPRALTGST